MRSRVHAAEASARSGSSREKLASGESACVIIFVSEYVLRNELVSVPLMLAWFLLAAAVAIPLINLAAHTVGARRENLALVAQGK